jgi:uncharacterized protein YbaR (Trm112 family)
MTAPGELICVGCGAAYPPGERFCPDCRMPLTFAEPAQDTPSDRHRKARKIRPQLAEGELVRVASARNQAEAEFIQSLLLEEGVPSLLRRSAGFDVPDFLAAGPRDVLVPESGVATARDVLLQAEIVGPDDVGPPGTSPLRLLLALVVALALGALLVWLLGSVL